MSRMAQDIIIAPVISEESFALMSGEKNKVRKDPKEAMKSARYQHKVARAESTGETVREPLPPRPVCKKYVFRVDRKATKPEVAAAVEAMFAGTKVASVNIINRKKKPKRMGVHAGYTSAWKKAIVTLKADCKPIEFFEGLN